MSGFSSEEVQAAVDRFLLKEVTVARMPGTGSRDVVAVRDRVYDLLTTTLLLRTDSYFYVTWLAKNRLRNLVAQQLASLAAIDTWADGVSRPSKLINSTTELVNAQAAVVSLNAGLNARTTGVRGPIGPAVDRFRTSIDRFVRTELTKNVVVSGVVTETAEELRALISTEWAAARARNTEIDIAVANLTEALTALGSVRLPEASVRDIVGRISDRLLELQAELTGATAIAQSREAMLELLTMRSLLSKAADFRNPLRLLMPLGADSNTGVLLDSSGTQAGITGTVTGPFNYVPGTVLDLSLNSAATTPSIALPSTSRAEVRSQALSFPSGPGGGAALALSLDYTGAITTVSPAASYASGAAAASAIDALFGTVTVAFDAATTQLVFQSDETGDASHLRFLNDTAVRQQSTDWLFGGPAIESVGAPVSAAAVAAAINAGSPDVEATVVEVFYTGFGGERTATGGEEDLIWNRTDLGADLVADGTSVVSSPSKNFEALGVVVGDGVVITAPGPSAGTFTVTAVDGPDLTLSGSVAATGAATYYTGPNYASVPVGARVQVTGAEDTDNSGHYRVLLGEVARIQTDIDLRGADVGLRVSVYTRRIEIEARGTTTSSGIGVLAGSAGATALGFAVTAAEAVAELTTLQLSGAGDFLQRGVRVGDAVSLISPALTSYTRAVSSVTTTRMILTEAVPVEAGAWSYTIQSQRYLNYDIVQAAAEVYAATAYTGDGVAALDAVMTRLIGGARYTSTLSVPINNHSAALLKLRDALDDYVIPRETAVDNIVKTMREQGLNRAVDLLLTLDIIEFFSMDADGASYTTNLVRKSATAARQVTPVSKYAKSDRVIQELRPVSYQPNPYDPLAE